MGDTLWKPTKLNVSELEVFPEGSIQTQNTHACKLDVAYMGGWDIV